MKKIKDILTAVGIVIALIVFFALVFFLSSVRFTFNIF
jgi:hypothetical protein